MRWRMVDNLIQAWLRRLGFDDWWLVSIDVTVSSTWHQNGKRVVRWTLDSDDPNRDVCIYVSLGLGDEEEISINLDFEYIIVYSLLQILHENEDDCCCELMHNKTATMLGRPMLECILL